MTEFAAELVGTAILILLGNGVVANALLRGTKGAGGGTTGYAINPARDLAPRVMHALLPMGEAKGDSDWGYAWVPVAGPVIGGLLAAAAYVALNGPDLTLPVLSAGP